MTLQDELRRVHDEMAKIQARDPATCDPPFKGWMLWLVDAYSEEVLILEEISKMKKVLTDQEIRDLYPAAQQRAVQRKTDKDTLLLESCDGFRYGILCASEGDFPEAYETKILDRLETEDNFSFAFICGVLCRLESVKGKGYQASWQRRGEKDGAMVNVERKFDRLDSTVRRGASGESLCEVLGDLSVYGIKWLCLQGQARRAETLQWLRRVRALNDKNVLGPVGI